MGYYFLNNSCLVIHDYILWFWLWDDLNSDVENRMRKAGKIASRAVAVTGVKRNKALPSLGGCSLGKPILRFVQCNFILLPLAMSFFVTE